MIYNYCMRIFLRDIGQTILISALILIIINFLTQSYMVQGASMNPLLNEDQRLFVNKLSYIPSAVSIVGDESHLLSGPQRGDIIVFRPPDGTQKDYVKRIIGIPGDWIDLDGKNVYVNGEKTDWTDFSTKRIRDQYPLYVKQGEYYVLGDNRMRSVDSRNWGTISANSISGKVSIVYWPFNDWKIIKTDQ
ncbi:MAG: signal peptidase I [Chloroflexi bacterium]|nr:signal peptidase I [Chloroflexota bacterium]